MVRYFIEEPGHVRIRAPGGKSQYVKHRKGYLKGCSCLDCSKFLIKRIS